MAFQRPHSVSTATPLRVSLAGGGTDIPSYFEHNGGGVVSMAIRQFVYVTVKRHSPLFGEKYRVSYSTSEAVNSVSEIKNRIVRACIEFTELDEPLHVLTTSDLPAESGLGSSSSFCVGLLRALHEIRGDSVSAGQLAEEACQIEIDILGKPIGKQDQYAAAYGGLSYFEFRTDGSVSCEALPIDRNLLGVLSHLFLVWSGIPRSADSILEDQAKHRDSNEKGLTTIFQVAKALRDTVRDRSLTVKLLGDTLQSGWKVKQELSSKIQSDAVRELLHSLEVGGSSGHKVSGAGGGGFVVGVAPKEALENLRIQFGPAKFLQPGISANGSWTLGKVF